MSNFKIKPDISNELVNEAINELHRSNNLISTKIPIYEIQGIQVQILITKDEEEIEDNLSLDYLNAVT